MAPRLDLLLVRGHRRLGFEFKRTTSPSLTPSMRTAMVNLKLESLIVVHAGHHTFTLAPKVKATPFSGLLEEMVPMKSEDESA